MTELRVQDIVQVLESTAALAYQEDYDNSGLLTGNKDQIVNGAILSLDCTEEVVDEAIQNNCNLIVAHHPIIFTGLKKLNGSNYVQRTIIKAIQHNIAIYACHTSLDNIKEGVNHKIAEKLGLKNLRILSPKKGLLKKLVTFVPLSHHQELLNSLFEAGAGNIGNYSECSFSLEGTGTFKGNASSKPFLGTANVKSTETELRLEVVFDAVKESDLISALLKVHPYEEVAFDIYVLSNKHPQIGSGMLGTFENQLSELEFLTKVKDVFKVPVLRHTKKTGKPIQKVAICGGSGQFLLKSAIQNAADAYITSDFKYHEFFDVESKLLLVDTGHFESEQFTPEIFYTLIQKKFPTFAIRLSKINTNPIHYF